MRNGNPNFIKCYSKYLETYKKIVNKARGQAPINSLSSAYVAFGRNRNCKILPILHNANKRIRVQPTTISRRRSGIKSSLAQPFGPKPTLKKKGPMYDAGQEKKERVKQKEKPVIQYKHKQPKYWSHTLIRS